MTVLKHETLRSMASDSVTVDYEALGAALTETPHIAMFVNGSDKAVLISFDGTNPHIHLVAGASATLDYGNSGALQQSTQIYVKLVAAGAASAGALVTAMLVVPKIKFGT